MNYERHYFSSCWPDITGEDYEHLKDSIHASGLRDAITLYEGKILDGWNRYRACIDMAMPAHYVEFEGTLEEAEQFVQDKHNRRSLTLTQRLTCIGLMRQRPSAGRPKNTEGPSVLTAKDMAKKVGSSVRYAEHVNEAIAKGAPALVESMKAGKVGAEKAAAIAKLPKRQQAAAIDKPLPKAEKFTQPVHDTSADELQESAQAIESLSEEVEVLKAELAVKHMDATGEEKSQAATLIAELRAELKSVNAELDAMRVSRDGLQRENRELMKQCGIYQRQLKQAQKV